MPLPLPALPWDRDDLCVYVCVCVHETVVCLAATACRALTRRVVVRHTCACACAWLLASGVPSTSIVVLWF